MSNAVGVVRRRETAEEYFLRTLIEGLDPARQEADAEDARTKFTFYGAAETLLTSTAPEILISGAAGTGKSLACLQKLHQACLDYPGVRCLIIRKTRASLTESALFTFETFVLGADHPLTYGRGGDVLAREARRVYLYPNGSEIVVGGLDKATRILSTEFDLIYVQEAIELDENDWEILTTRIGRRNKSPYSQLLADTNPDSPMHWLKQRADRSDTVLVEGRHEDNPLLYNRETHAWTPMGLDYLARLDKLTGKRYERLRWGRWVLAQGAVYTTWDTGVHLINHFDPPREWRRIRIIDFGYSHPFVCHWIALDPDGRMFLYREIYMTGRIVADHGEQIKTLSVYPDRTPEHIEATICDHDAEDRATLARAGIKTIPAQKEVSVGIQAVQARLRVADDGRPRFFVMRDCLVERDETLEEAKLPWCTQHEFPGYVWARSKDGTSKEDPVKEDDHGMDCVRYGIMYVDHRPKRQMGQRATRGLGQSIDRFKREQRSPARRRRLGGGYGK